MADIDITLKDVGCIEEGKVTIASNKLNIKFGPNGIGKTTIIKALKYRINNDSDMLKYITPLGYYNKKPSCELTGNIQNLAVYDKVYFDKLFTKREDLLNDTYKFVIKDSDYDSEVSKIKDSLKHVIDIANRQEFSDFIDVYNTLISKEFVKNTKTGGVNIRDSLFSSFASKSIDFKSIDQKSPIAEYSKYISSSFKVLWLKWIESYKLERTIGDVCPFCGQKFHKENFTLQKNIEELKKFASSKEVLEHSKEQKNISDAALYCSKPELKKDILDINTLTGKADKNTFAPLQFFVDEIKEQIKKIQTIRGQGAITLFNAFLYNNKKFDELFKYIKSLKLDENVITVTSNQSDGTIDLVKALNLEIDSLMTMTEFLRQTLAELTKNLTSKIKKNERIINDFFKICGLPYKVNIKGENDEVFKTLFTYKNDSNIIDDRLNYLSYGEANVLAIIIFAIENRDNASLIVLDDPVSSFDSNKRYAIYQYLFSKKSNLLYGKTILLMTHDFQTVVAFAKTLDLKDYGITFNYLLNLNNIMIEQPFSEDKIISSLTRYNEYAKNDKYDLYSRIVAVRRIYEINTGTYTDMYNYLSGLIHFDNQPKHSKKGSSQSFTDSEIAECDKELSEFLNYQYDYKMLLNKISDYKYLIENYEKKETTNFAKTCITRCLVLNLKRAKQKIKENKESDVMWNFMCESFHVETQYIYSIADISTLDIPNYIISLCDEIVSMVKTTLNL